MRKPGGAALALAIGLLACAGARAGEDPASAPAPPGAEAGPPGGDEISAYEACRKYHKRTEILLDMASRRLQQTVCGAALWFDGLFGEGDLDAARMSYGHVELGTAYSEFSGSRTRLRFIARFPLPAMEQRLSAFVGVDDDEDFVRDRSEGQALRSRRRVSDRDTFLLGLGFAGFTSDRFQSDFKVGVREFALPKVFVQNRFNWIPYSDQQNRLILRITPFWDNRDLFGATTHTSLDRIIEEAFLLRWTTALTVSEQIPGTDWRSAVILYQNLLGTKALAYETFVRGASGAPEPLGEYGVRVVYRWPLFRESLIGQVVPGYSWPRDDPALPRQGAADISVGIEMPFGKDPG